MTSSNSSVEEIVFRGQLITRQLARMHRNRIENALEKPGREGVLVDVSQVEVMTPSFADECFGVLAERYGKESFRRRVRIRAADENVRHLLAAVIGQRLSRRKGVVE